MKKLSEVPFISISKENLMAASDMLDREQMGELMEMIIDAVLNDGYPSSSNKCVNGVFNQFISVIERKAAGYANRVKPLEEINEERKKQAEEQKKKEQEANVSVYTEAHPKQVERSDAVDRFFKQNQGFLATAENRLRNGDRSVNDDIQMRINTYADKYGITDEEIQQIWESI